MQTSTHPAPPPGAPTPITQADEITRVIKEVNAACGFERYRLSGDGSGARVEVFIHTGTTRKSSKKFSYQMPHGLSALLDDIRRGGENYVRQHAAVTARMEKTGKSAPDACGLPTHFSILRLKPDELAALTAALPAPTADEDRSGPLARLRRTVEAETEVIRALNLWPT